MKLRPATLIDFYKSGHIRQYPDNTTLIYSNFTPRSGSHFPIPGTSKVLFVGLQGIVKWLLIDLWNKEFFEKPLSEVLDSYNYRMNSSLGVGSVSCNHIVELHKLGYLPLEIKALPEGSLVPFKIPFLTIKNTLPEFFWLVNYLEDMLSAEGWKSSTNATIAYKYRELLDRYARLTGAPMDFCAWQGHDFSFRGLSGVYDASSSGIGHLVSFLGTDTVPSLDYIDEYYKGSGTFIGGSVPATEHSVMCMGGEETELETFSRLLDLYPEGVLSIVSDTWNFWNVITNTAATLKDKILARKPNALGMAKVVFRPDSGDPVRIICGDSTIDSNSAPRRGAVECLWDLFGGTINAAGYKVLHERVGLIYGDSITYERAHRILERLKDKGFASNNIVFGIGSYTYQHNTRDSLGFAMKATYGEVNGVGRELFKDPVTDSGIKKSAKGLLRVEKDQKEEFILQDQQTWEQEAGGELRTVFKDGKLLVDESFAEIRKRVGMVM
jgi:nicotinamide phosphoribosyltransferase